MKNNRLKNYEVVVLRNCVDEIRHFASMEKQVLAEEMMK